MLPNKPNVGSGIWWVPFFPFPVVMCRFFSVTSILFSLFEEWVLLGACFENFWGLFLQLLNLWEFLFYFLYLKQDNYLFERIRKHIFFVSSTWSISWEVEEKYFVGLMLHNRGEYGVTHSQILTWELQVYLCWAEHRLLGSKSQHCKGNNISYNWISVIKGAGGAQVSPFWPPAPETPSTRGVLPGSSLPAPFWPLMPRQPERASGKLVFYSFLFHLSLGEKSPQSHPIMDMFVEWLSRGPLFLPNKMNLFTQPNV